MKALAIVLFMLAGIGALAGLRVITTTVAAGWPTYLGAFAIPALLVWWGVIALRVADRRATRVSKSE